MVLDQSKDTLRAPRVDKGFLVLEPCDGFIDDGGHAVHLGRLLVEWGWIPSVREMKKLHGVARFKVIPADGTSNVREPIFATREINNTFVLLPGDVIASDDGTNMRKWYPA